jgi:non-heme chloroperoxidase
MLFLAQHGCRAIAHDRRGHGRSGQTSSGNGMNTYSDDLAALIDHHRPGERRTGLHSTGGGEVTRYVGRYGTKRVNKLIVIAAVPPLLLESDTSPEGFL